ncbi:glycosyltransferase family 2 protein [Actinoplanes teichomyceticus]|uniref:Cellulose synthase/poly-beta-1,6-N-acetylglucosamine synthase-like glycosyltransferase n=1 Tax=Actinoplanes teichomyceticus TaxID=1867 RepID=A0A561VQ55_ACTTI|nr:glycosyltransferase family 2 protein [Actinoplanes teichomyceticus]TWG13764.1 cellulose synthase/poly-beta-1,6-N-acetylglucosamine synthase-like glycosyltransferase [Actinoplanes teichomyceticus]GIF12410.1 glycosyl transferase [Actinoplanes teichomyceticus]
MSLLHTPDPGASPPARETPPIPGQRAPAGRAPMEAESAAATLILPSRYNYSAYSVLAGPADPPPAPDGGYRVAMHRMTPRRPIRTLLITLFAFAFESTFLGWLIAAIEVPDQRLHPVLFVATTFMLVATTAIELFRLVNVVTLSLATLWARDPRPVVPDTGTRVAFLTTIVPGKEPIEMVEKTLRAARRIRYAGHYQVWLLDEGDDPLVKLMCKRLGVRHFSRRGRAEYNQPAGAFKARTKHGNYNAWLDAHGDEYDVFVSVDPDHVPLPNFCERLLGYFRDPDVAFVVGPQIYGNYDNLITRWAESQQYLFHSLLQRAGNRRGIAMLVGTNNAVRIAALKSIGGLQDSITEDMATSLAVHAARNPATGRRWRSVYTPDVLAVGEGPSSWTDFFTQQHRWSRGTDEVVVRSFAGLLRRLGPGRALHYALLMSYYPLTALAWLLGAVNAACFLLLGAKGVQVPQQVWLMLYVDAALFQVGLYLFNRRHNVSPHEESGSTGLRGMLASTLCTPIYVSSLIGAALRRTAGFVVTPKGDSTSPDRLATFRPGLRWAAFYAVLLAVSPIVDHVDPAMYAWPALNLLICLTPVALWLIGRARTRKETRA